MLPAMTQAMQPAATVAQPAAVAPPSAAPAAQGPPVIPAKLSRLVSLMRRMAPAAPSGEPAPVAQAAPAPAAPVQAPPAQAPVNAPPGPGNAQSLLGAASGVMTRLAPQPKTAQAVPVVDAAADYLRAWNRAPEPGAAQDNAGFNKDFLARFGKDPEPATHGWMGNTGFAGRALKRFGGQAPTDSNDDGVARHFNTAARFF